MHPSPGHNTLSHAVLPISFAIAIKIAFPLKKCVRAAFSIGQCVNLARSRRHNSPQRKQGMCVRQESRWLFAGADQWNMRSASREGAKKRSSQQRASPALRPDPFAPPRLRVRSVDHRIHGRRTTNPRYVLGVRKFLKGHAQRQSTDGPHCCAPRGPDSIAQGRDALVADPGFQAAECPSPERATPAPRPTVLGSVAPSGLAVAVAPGPRARDQSVAALGYRVRPRWGRGDLASD